jgi:hypothetical protein
MGTERVAPSMLHGFEYRELKFDRAGDTVDHRQIDAIRALRATARDLLVISHGWNNDEADAFNLYERLAASMSAVWASPAYAGSSIARPVLVGVFWPSKKFADADLIPGGAATVDDECAALRARIDALRGTFDAPYADDRFDRALELSSGLAASPSALAEFVEVVRGLVTEPSHGDHDGDGLFHDLDATVIADRLTDPTLGDPDLWSVQPSPADVGSVLLAGAPIPFENTGVAAFLGPPESLATAARRLLNLATFYQMKERAGLVGRCGLAPVLADVVAEGQRLHLVGHSFGARVVTSAASLEAGPPLRSMCLLQAAFSHYAFAQNWEPGQDGAFRSVLTSGRLSGPIMVTHTRNDHAVGIAYAIASRLAHQVAATVGDADSRYGGLGGNGALCTPEAVGGVLLPADRTYRLVGGRVYNLLADLFVKGHGDVTGIEVANAVLGAMWAGSHSLTGPRPIR